MLFNKNCLVNNVVLSYRVEMAGLIRPDSRDVREIIDREIAKQETRLEQLVKQWEEK